MIASRSPWEPLWVVAVTPDELDRIEGMHTCTPMKIEKGAHAGMFLLRLWSYEWHRVSGELEESTNTYGGAS